MRLRVPVLVPLPHLARGRRQALCWVGSQEDLLGAPPGPWWVEVLGLVLEHLFHISKNIFFFFKKIFFFRGPQPGSAGSVGSVGSAGEVGEVGSSCGGLGGLGGLGGRGGLGM